MINFYSNMSFDEMMKEISYENFEQAKQKFNDILQNYSFVSIDFDAISVKLK